MDLLVVLIILIYGISLTIQVKRMVHLRALEMRHYINSGLLTLLVESYEVHACIVTCGELCPGLNTVIRENCMRLI
jgi:hypothetical protein